MQARLWELAERHTPHRRVRGYTQAIMDLGATLCTRTRPSCLVCPVAAGCRARETGDPARFPAPRPRRPHPTREKLMVVMHDAKGRVLVERRPPSGIWGGLWSFPEASPDLDFGDAAAQAARRHGLRARPRNVRPLAPVEHGFTHFRLRATPLLVSVEPLRDRVAEDVGTARWIEPDAADRAGGTGVGLAAPVGAVLSRLEQERRGGEGP